MQTRGKGICEKKTHGRKDDRGRIFSIWKRGGGWGGDLVIGGRRVGGIVAKKLWLDVLRHRVPKNLRA